MKDLKISIESWAPEYGSPVGDALLEATKAQVKLNVEVEVADWKPLQPKAGTRKPEQIIFVDGVRRMESIVWISENGQNDLPGICASFAAGALEVGQEARLLQARVRRVLLSSHPGVQALGAGALRFEPEVAAADGIYQLQEALSQHLNSLEIEIAEAVSDQSALVMVDGPLKGHRRLKNAIGYIKTHHVSYLQDSPVAGIVSALPPGCRTPVFLSTTSWTRYSWYLRLPGTGSYAWAGIVRLEASGKLSMEEVAGLADQTCLVLPGYASQPHKDPRSPQNLVPIGGLENELRRRLGDPSIIYRALRKAAESE